MNELDRLRTARALIPTPRRWRKDAYGQHGRSCLLGAYFRAGGIDPPDDLELAAGEYDAVVEADLRLAELLHLPTEFASAFNDSQSHAEVLAALDDAIARLAEHESGDPLPPLPALHPELVS